MSHKNSLIRKIVKEFAKTIERMKKEFDPSYGELVGALEVTKHVVLEQIDSLRYVSDLPEDDDSGEIERILKGESKDDEDEIGPEDWANLPSLEDIADTKALPVDINPDTDLDRTVEDIQAEIIESMQRVIETKEKTIVLLEAIIKDVCPERLDK